jgi:hypothetical protein
MLNGGATAMKNVRWAIPGAILAIGLISLQPALALAATEFDGDAFEVVTDKQTYLSSEPIVVTCRFTNIGEVQGLKVSTRGLALRVSGEIYPRGTQVLYAFAMKSVFGPNGGIVSGHSTIVAAYGTIPANTLKPGVYKVDLIVGTPIVVDPSTGLRYGRSFRPSTVIQVK